MSWALADATGDARALVETTLPVVAQLLSASAVVLVSEHPGLGGARFCARAPRPGPGSDGGADELAAALVSRVETVLPGLGDTGAVVAAPDLGCTLLVAPLPRSGRGDGWVAAAVRSPAQADSTDLAILGTVTNQLAGAIESSRRLSESEALRGEADVALREAALHAEALARRNRLLKEVRHELVSARERELVAEERQRIARDLHDSVAQHVLSIGMQVEACRTSTDSPQLAERLGEVKELARSTVHHIRSAIFELSGDEVQVTGLPAALERLARQHHVHGLEIEVAVTGADRRLPAAVERALFMVAKEALFNTVVHAEARRAHVHLVLGWSEVRLVVSDDGLGSRAVLLRSLEHARQACRDGYHRGLVNMDDRVLAVGGRLHVQDTPGGGVTVEVRVPLSRYRGENS